MLPLSDFPVAARRDLRGVFCDIDETLTTGGRLTAEAYGALERLERAGLLVVPITGRPAGWCDHIARMWPVAAVVGENGAFYFRYDRAARAMRRAFADEPAARAANRERLRAIAAEIVQAVPGCAIAADQHYRETDLAIDYCEDVARLPREAVDRIVALMQARGLTAKRDHPASALTLPDRKRLEVARALATRPKLLLLDEVMAGLRPTECDEIIAVFRELNRTEGLTILLIEHVMRAVMALAQRIVVLHHGEVIARGGPEQVVRDPAVLECYLGEEAEV